MAKFTWRRRLYRQAPRLSRSDSAVTGVDEFGHWPLERKPDEPTLGALPTSIGSRTLWPVAFCWRQPTARNSCHIFVAIDASD